MFRSRKLIYLKKMQFLKKQKMLQNLESSYSKVGWKYFSFASNTIYWKLVRLFTFFCFKVSATFINVCEIFCSTDWFQQPKEFTNEIENMGVHELIKLLAKFYVSVRKTDGSYYKKTSLLSIRAALDRHLKAPKSFKKSLFFILFSWIIMFTFIKFNSLFTAYTIKKESSGQGQ